jgi:hypothetical protein
MSINIEYSPFSCVGRFFQFPGPPRLDCPDRVFDQNPKTGQAGFFVYLNTGNGFDSGKQWQSNLGGPGNWKNRPTHENGEHSMLIDINGDGLPDRVFDRNPKTDQQGLYQSLGFYQILDQVSRRHLCQLT